MASSSGDSDASDDDEGVPSSDEPSASEPVDAAPQAEDEADDDIAAPPSPMQLAIRAFVGSSKGQQAITSFIVEQLGPKIQPALLDDLRQGASLEAVTADWPPWTQRGIPRWLRRVTRRSVAAHFKGERVHKENLDLGASAEDQRDRDHDGADVTARERAITEWLRMQIQDDKEIATLDLMAEHELAGVSLSTLAERERTTPSGLSNRFSKLRKKYGPRVSLMDDEPTRRGVLLAIFLFGIVAVAVFLVRLLSPASAPTPAPPPSATPAPLTAPAPSTFNQAAPTPPPSAPPSAPPVPEEAPVRDKPPLGGRPKP